MPERYSVTERLRDGREIEIRSLHPEDEADMLAAVGRTSPLSLQRRFFVAKRSFSEREIAFFMNIDFRDHVALVALASEEDRPTIVGGGRYVAGAPGSAEIAFIVIDEWQSRGIGSLLARHLITLARRANLTELVAEVLPENTPMLHVFKRLGFHPQRGGDPQVVHLVLKLD
jgi:RimJ/RimL family protein N-acetyltransferase